MSKKIVIGAALLAALLLFTARAKAAPKKQSMYKIALPAISGRLKAFLLMLQHSEGTLRYANPYAVIVGGGTFSDFSRHPNKLVRLSPTLASTAAGAYQFLKRTWDGLGLPDFSPANQDRGAIKLIQQAGALSDIESGNIAQAIAKCRKIWASLPGAGYGQSEKNLASLVAFYNSVV